MKRPITALLCLLAIGWISPTPGASAPAFAHEDGAATQPSKPRGDAKRDPIMVALEKLDLTEDQHRKINAYIEETKAKIKQVYLQKRDGDKEDLRKAIHELRSKLVHQIAGELTEEQKKKFLSMMEEFRDEHERKGKDAGKSKGSDSSAPPDKKGDGGQKDDGWETAK